MQPKAAHRGTRGQRGGPTIAAAGGGLRGRLIGREDADSSYIINSTERTELQLSLTEWAKSCSGMIARLGSIR